MIVPFIKMQGAGNDYIYFDCVTHPFSADWAALSIRLSDRHFGIGGDGIVLILPSDTADLRMRIFNADGSEAEMCGNASRCIGRYAFAHHLVSGSSFTLETKGGLRTIYDGEEITVDMGERLGNPHAVFFVDELTDALVLGEGPKIECAPEYPNRTNVEFVVPIDRHQVRMRVWERGSGETWACGTGACATAMESVRTGRCDYPVRVMMRGGTLTIDHRNGHILMSGPATEVFTGVVNV